MLIKPLSHKRRETDNNNTIVFLKYTFTNLKGIITVVQLFNNTIIVYYNNIPIE